MPQFLLPPGALREDPERPGMRLFVLTGSEAVHVSKVLRRREGDSIDLFDGQGARYQGTITRLRGDLVEGEIALSRGEPDGAPALRLVLYQGLIKGDRWEWLLEKATELGVARIVPVTTSRTVVLLKEQGRIAAKLERWRKIVLAAAKQCGRGDIPEVSAPMDLKDALTEATAAGPVLFAWEKANPRSTVRKALEGLDPGRAISIFVGPEGGFEVKEADLARASGARVIALGPTTLRAETAAINAAGIILYELSAYR